MEIRWWVTQKLPHIYTANQATFPIQIRKIAVQICDNLRVTQYAERKINGRGRKFCFLDINVSKNSTINGWYKKVSIFNSEYTYDIFLK